MTFRLRAFAGDETTRWAQRLAAVGRVRVANLLAGQGADVLLDEARRRTPFQTVTTNSRGHVDLSAAWLDSLSPNQRIEFGRAVQESAVDRFQYLYDSYPLFDIARGGGLSGPWRDLLDFLNGEDFLTFIRSVTNEPRIAFADAQVTRYRKGSFLTGHSDEAPGKERYFAYVLNLTPGWKAEWGGLLMFHREDGDIDEAFTPVGNTLNILRVPQSHSVSQVALSAGDDRISVTGWLRGGAP